MINTFKSFVEQCKFKPGDRVKNINPDCKQYRTTGKVTKVSDIKGRKGNIIGKKVEYKCDCNGDKLEKTVDQLKKK